MEFHEADELWEYLFKILRGAYDNAPLRISMQLAIILLEWITAFHGISRG